MSYRLLPLVLSLAVVTLSPLPAMTNNPIAAPVATYPKAERQDIAEDHFGVKVADPYRWLENDVREDARVRAWVTAENEVTNAYLASLPARAMFAKRIRQLFDYERYGVPDKKGGRYFYAKNDGLQNQAVLYVRESLAGPARMLVDPNLWSKDGATALGEWTPSEDGKHLLYSVQDGGTDWRTLRVLDVDNGRLLVDEVKWVKFSNLEWAKDGSGFFYSRFPEPQAEQQFQSLNENQRVYFHRLGTPQSADRLVYADAARPMLNNVAEVSDDGRWLIVSSSEGTDERYDITLIDLVREAPPRRIVAGLANDWRYIGNQGDTFYWVTNLDAPRLRIVATDIGRPVSALKQIVAEDKATLDQASIVGDRLIVSYLVDAKTEVRTMTRDGTRIGTVSLPGIGTASGFAGDARDSETFYAFSSFNRPTTIYRYDSAGGATSPFAEPEVAFDPADFAVEQRFYISKDGTRVPLFLVHRKDQPLGRPAPTLLYGYGGFNISLTPSFSAANLAWIEQGGVLAVANLRGGGEYGKAWHDAGRLAEKQNVFDDFIAAGEYLIAQGVTSNRQLAIHGRSNGGLLVGAVVNQRP
ncbi:MAG: family peptidase, partial [Alphaproteobacteria bacterium]|nr:family peptidase [Alphaproteobacteria bacterium]